MVNEDSEIYAYDEYEQSKINAEKWLFEQKNMNVIILRPTTVYGADMPNQSLKSLFSAILNDRFFFIEFILWGLESFNKLSILRTNNGIEFKDPFNNFINKI